MRVIIERGADHRPNRGNGYVAARSRDAGVADGDLVGRVGDGFARRVRLVLKGGLR